MRLAACPLIASLALLYAEAPARANGRYPAAQMIVSPAGDDGLADRLVVRTTFGLLLSPDAGRSWRWVCEQALGFDGAWDPPIAATPDGRVFVGLATGLRVMTDGCDAREVPALAGELVADLTVEGVGARARAFAVTSSPGRRAFVWRERADASWERLGKGVAGFRFDTLEVAPSRPARVYLTAVPEKGGGAAGHIFRSDDGGATISELSPTLERDGRLFVSGIDPRDADRVFVRQLHPAGSELLLSTDGGAHFRVVLHVNASMPGFAIANDGATIYAGSSNPGEGVFRSDDRGERFAQVGKTSVKCLHARADRLYVCSDPFSPGGYAVALSLDRGATVTRLTTFEIDGPVACDGGAGVVCASRWGEARAAIAATADEIASSRPAPTEAGAAPATSAPPPPPARRACGCRIAGQPRPSGGRSAIALVVCAAMWGVRRAGRTRPAVDPMRATRAACEPRARWNLST